MEKIALLGRPNVGKSTLFNRLIRSNRAITHDRPGVTRDRMEGICHPQDGAPFVLIDTGGVTLDEHAHAAEGPKASHGFEQDILHQAEAAVNDAVAICLVMDGQDGLTPFDEHLAAFARRQGKPVLLVVNKVDGLEREDALLADFHALGFDPVAVSAEHGHNLRYIESLLADMASDDATTGPTDKDGTLRIAMLGRPNAGKSSLVNAFIGDSRMIVSDIAGTTRDSVDVPFEREGDRYVFVDTAGVRRRARIDDSVEKFAVNASIKSTTKADVTIYVMDATEGVTAQDKRLIELLDERKTPFVILVNKIDRIPHKERLNLKKDFAELLEFCPHVPVLSVSALTGAGLGAVLPTVKAVHAECSVRVPTSKLNEAMKEVLERHQPPIVKRARPKFFYLTQAETRPPTFVFFVSDADRVLDSYVRYLEKNLRKLFSIKHAPMRLNLRSSHGKEAK